MNISTLLMSSCVFVDIVFLRSWYPVSVPQLYNPVTSLLMSVGQKDKWTGMRTLGQLKHDLEIRNQPNQDSLYKVVYLYSCKDRLKQTQIWTRSYHNK